MLYTLRHPDYGAAPNVNIWVKYILNIAFLRGLSELLRFSLVGQGWTLTVEECFYISAPFIILGLVKLNSNLTKPNIFFVINFYFYYCYWLFISVCI